MSVNNVTSGAYVTILEYLCFDSVFIRYMSLIYNCTYFILAFPITVTILFLGFQRWRLQGFSSPAMSHSDFFTYHMAAMELIGLLGAVLSICSGLTQIPMVAYLGLYVVSFPWTAQMTFPMLICLERYLAVVKPITYLRARQAAGIRIRNISTAFIWLYSFGGLSGITLSICYRLFNFLPACLMAVCLMTVTFCSLSILYVLIRQRPGNMGPDRMRVDKSKRRAFRIILIIMGVLFFRFGGNAVCYSLTVSVTSHHVWCLAIVSGFWFNLPSSLVLPLLFLQRNGKIPCCRSSSE